MSDTSIVNMALHRLGTERINALSDNNKRAKLMNDIFDTIRKVTLENGGWSFARKRVKLSPTTTTPEFGFTYQFLLPSDCLKALTVQDSSLIDITYKKEGRFLYSDEPLLYVVYIYDIEDDSQYSGLFKRAFALELAVEGSYSMNQNVKMRESFIAELDDKYSDARCNDSQEAGPDEYIIDDFLTVRG